MPPEDFEEEGTAACHPFSPTTIQSHQVQQDHEPLVLPSTHSLGKGQSSVLGHSRDDSTANLGEAVNSPLRLHPHRRLWASPRVARGGGRLGHAQ